MSRGPTAVTEPPSFDGPDPETGFDMTEFLRCAAGVAGFIYWCRNYVYIDCKVTKRPRLFDLYDCQISLVTLLFDGRWVMNLKARQLGITWLIACWVLWKVTFTKGFTCIATNQNRDYAAEFLERILYMRERLPEWMQIPITKQGRYHLQFNAEGHGAWVKSLASTKGTARSFTCDFAYFDEGGHQDFLRRAIGAAEPALEAQGQIAITGTSSGPGHYFEELWHDDENQYEKVFFSWNEHPARDQAWYDDKERTHRSDPLWICREYPNTPEEAFQSHEGRVYPAFSAGAMVGGRYAIGPNVRPLKMYDENQVDLWPIRYRAIDWGMQDPFVVLFLAHDPDRPTALTVAPACVNTIREMMKYSYREGTDYPLDRSNHCPDALRYAIIQWDITAGHLHVYREIYIEGARAKNLDTVALHQIATDASRGEDFNGTVADRSGASDIVTFCRLGMPVTPAMKLGVQKALSASDGMTTKEILAGIRQVNNLIVATPRLDEEIKLNPVDLWARRIQRPRGGDQLRPSNLTDAAHKEQALLRLGRLDQQNVRRQTHRRSLVRR